MTGLHRLTGLERGPRTAKTSAPVSLTTSSRHLPFYLCLLAVALAYAVLMHGGRDLFDWNVSLLIVAVGVITYWALAQRSPADIPALEPRLRWLALLVPAYIALQLIPLPVLLVRILSPERARIVDGLRSVMPSDWLTSLSISPAATFAHLFRIIGYLLVFLLVRELALRSTRPWLAITPLIVTAALESVLGLLQWVEGDTVQGTYWNRNHFAGLLEMAIPLAIAQAIVLLKGRHHDHSPSPGRTIAASAILFSAALMLIALIYSLSKMGFAACLGGLFVFAAAGSAASVRGRKRWWIVGVLGACFLLIFVFIQPIQLATAFSTVTSDATLEGRLPIWIDSLRLFLAYPLTGSGLGTYDTAFLRYQTVELDNGFDFAHNDYLEMATELGALGFLIMAALVVVVCAKSLRCSTTKFDRNTRYLAWGCTGAIAAIGLHSLTDFNLYVPSNAMALAWIFGIVASLPSHNKFETSDAPPAEKAPLKAIAIALGCLVLIFAPAWILLQGKYHDDAQAEGWFCRFGVCDTDAAVAAETAQYGGIVASVPVPQLLKALHRDPASPSRWADLGEAMLKSGQTEHAKYCFWKALTFGPNIPPIQSRAANFYYATHDPQRALQQTAHVLRNSALFDSQLFDAFAREDIPLDRILATGLGTSNQRAWQAYVRYLMNAGNYADAMTVWDWGATQQHFRDDGLVREYLNSLVKDHRYEPAARAWAAYLGDRAKGYLQSNWLYNGDFEAEPSGTLFDWRIESLSDDVTATLDAGVSHSGSRSLRIQFAGKKNVDYGGITQTAFVTPGRYRFAAFLRTRGITTDQGIQVRLYDPESPARLDSRTEQLTGTTDWKPVEQIVTVRPGTNLLAIQVVRPLSQKFDSHIEGTAWIDSVILSKLE